MELQQIGSASVDFGGVLRQVDIFSDATGEQMYFVDKAKGIVCASERDDHGNNPIVGRWDRKTQRATLGTEVRPQVSDSSDSEDSGAESAGSNYDVSAALKPSSKEQSEEEASSEDSVQEAIAARRYTKATLSDRLNPSHPAFDSDLKAKWKGLSKRERDALVIADKDTLRIRHETVAAIDHPFDAVDDDHCETSSESYGHIAPLLEQLARSLNKTPAELAIYDPYFCTGSVVGHMNDLGFQNVYNKCEDFYEVAKQGRTPPYDVLVTNPAYSGDHIERLLKFCADSGKPFLLLMPNYVYTKEYYTPTLGLRLAPRVVFMCPLRRYVYWTPKGLRSKSQSHASTLGSRTSPFITFWYMYLGPRQDEFISWWIRTYSARSGAVLARNIRELPLGARHGPIEAQDRQDYTLSRRKPFDPKARAAASKAKRLELSAQRKAAAKAAKAAAGEAESDGGSESEEKPRHKKDKKERKERKERKHARDDTDNEPAAADAAAAAASGSDAEGQSKRKHKHKKEKREKHTEQTEEGVDESSAPKRKSKKHSKHEAAAAEASD